MADLHEKLKMAQIVEIGGYQVNRPRAVEVDLSQVVAPSFGLQNNHELKR